jgi:hypothetical protein
MTRPRHKAAPLKRIMARNDWARQISVAWQKSVAAIFETGDLLHAAKAALKHGQFEKMVRNALPFRERTAQCLMAIAKDKRLRKANHGALLPPPWRTLYELTRLSDEGFDTALADGLIKPDMHREDVLALADRLREVESNQSWSPTSPREHEPTLAIVLAQPPESAGAWHQPSRREQVNTITDNALADLHRRTRAGYAVKGLLEFEANARECGVEAVLEILLAPDNTDKLERVRHGIAEAIRLKGAIDRAGLGNPKLLRLVDHD